jgi:hypothetical protein
MKYRMLAMDVDGTLVGPDSIVSPDIVAAVSAAAEAGIGLCLATGRSYVETVPIWRQLHLRRPYQSMIVIGGALVSEPDTGRSLYQKPIKGEVACRYADALGQAGHCAMVIVDPWRNDVDYFLTESGDVDEVQRRWFSKMNVKVRRVRRLADVRDLPDVLRLSAVVDDGRGAELAGSLKRRFDGQMNIHPIFAPNYGVMIVEALAAGADKFTALRYVVQGVGMPTAAVAAVGDDINDLSMIRGAGLGVAMLDSPQEVREAADHVAASGLSEFIHQLIDGRFEA